RGGTSDGAAGVRAKGARAQAGGGGDGGAGRRSRGRALHVPGIASGGKRALDGRTTERPLVHRELAEDDRAGIVQASRDEGVARSRGLRVSPAARHSASNCAWRSSVMASLLSAPHLTPPAARLRWAAWAVYASALHPPLPDSWARK